MKIDALLANRAMAERVEDLHKFIKRDELDWLEANIGKLSVRQLTVLLETGPADHLRDVARKQILASAAAKPHWTIVPAFVLLIIATLLAGIAAWPIVQSWLPKPPPAQTVPESQAPISGSGQPKG